MNRLQTLRMIACMLLMGVVAIAAYLFYQHSLFKYMTKNAVMIN